MTNIRAMAGTMHYKVHEWQQFGDEWRESGVSYLTVRNSFVLTISNALLVRFLWSLLKTCYLWILVWYRRNLVGIIDSQKIGRRACCVELSENHVYFFQYFLRFRLTDIC